MKGGKKGWGSKREREKKLFSPAARRLGRTRSQTFSHSQSESGMPPPPPWRMSRGREGVKTCGGETFAECKVFQYELQQF